MSEERLKILQMIQEGKINAEEGLELLKALEETEPKTTPLPNRGFSRLTNRFLRIRVNGGITKVNVNVPLNLIKVASKFATQGIKFIPEPARVEMEQKGIDLSTINFEELVEMIEQGLVDGKLIDVDVIDPNEGPMKVEVYVE